jgi:hypothetical protein
MKKLFANWGDRVSFLEILVRQAHPGPRAQPYHTFEDKMRDAERYQRVEGIRWPVAVDDLEGTVHQVYGGLADPSYLIDADGTVAFYDLWTSAPVLHTAITRLMDQGGHGVVRRGLHRRPHLGAAMTDGWRALQRGAPQSVSDLMRIAPGSPLLVWLGHVAKPVLAPATMRARPLPSRLRWGLTLAAIAGLWALRRARR